MIPKLKPCPCCGRSPSGPAPIGKTGWRSIWCACGHAFNVHDMDGPQALVREWNALPRKPIQMDLFGEAA